MTLAQAQGVTIGGNSAAAGNRIVGNQGYGLYAYWRVHRFRGASERDRGE